jgi:hypothetical protein
LSTTNPTCCPDTYLGCRGGKPATNCLSYDMAIICVLNNTRQCFLWGPCKVLIRSIQQYRMGYRNTYFIFYFKWFSFLFILHILSCCEIHLNWQ